MGINKVQLGIAVDSLMQEIVDATPSSHNIIPGRDEANAHPLSAITGLKNVTDKIENMSISQKTINEGFDYFYGHPDSVIPVATQYVPVTMKLGNMEFINNFVILKSKRTYEISIILGYANPGVKVFANIHYSVVANNVNIGYLSPYNEITASDYEYPPCINIVYTNEEDHDVQLGLRCDTAYNTDKISSAVSSFIVKEIAKQYIIDPLEYVNTTTGIEDTPVGSTISLMGKTAPKHYLICDGAVYNITDYPHLAQYFKDQFGTYNVYGGDGTTTFAVPDARDQFIRGYHGDKTEKLSGEPGIHQDGTNIPMIGSYASTTLSDVWIGSYLNQGSFPVNYDKVIKQDSKCVYITAKGGSNGTNTAAAYLNKPTDVAIRPTNISALICIKYEPTYFMRVNGLVEETVIWEGNVGTNSTTQTPYSINLNDSIQNYDEIGFYYQASVGTATRLTHVSIPSERFKDLINSTSSDITINLNWGQSPHVSFIDIKKTSTYLKLDLATYQSFLTKVVGAKYKTKQGEGGNDDTYTDQEIIDMMEDVINGYK